MINTKIIGIIPSTIGFESNNPFDNKYYVQNSYIKRLKKYNCIPIIIAPANLEIENDILDMCDSLLIIGGKDINNYHYKVIDYAIKTNKKLLGICLGMQAIACYSNNQNELTTLSKVENHYYDKTTSKNKELLLHDINIEKNTLLNKLLGEKIKVNSLHKYCVKKINLPFKVVGSYENIIEAIEYKNIIGVQFHPELMKKGENLFKWLTN